MFRNSMKANIIMAPTISSAFSEFVNVLTSIFAGLFNSLMAVFQAIIAFFMNVLGSTVQLFQSILKLGIDMCQGLVGFVTGELDGVGIRTKLTSPDSEFPCIGYDWGSLLLVHK